MHETTGSFQTSDNLKIHTIQWLSDGTPKAVVIIVHGMGEHSGRYKHVAEALVNEGYAAYALDHRGHGRSDGERVSVVDNNHFVDDLKQYFDTVKAKHPDDKIFVLGHSMGSIISLQFALKYQQQLAGMVITGTATDTGSNVAGWMRPIVNGLHRVAPHLPFLAPGTADILTRDKAMQQAWEADELNNHGRTPLSTPKFIVDTGAMIQDNASQLTLPIMFMHGEADELTPISGSRIMFESVSSSDKTLKTYPDMRHEIMNEIGREDVIQTIIDWFNNH